MHGQERKIAGVAVRWRGKLYSLPAPKRHHDVIFLIHQATGDANILAEEGFVTDDGVYVTREHAAQIALAAGQTDNLQWPPRLFSEDLW